MVLLESNKASLAAYSQLTAQTIYRWDGYDMILDYLKDAFDKYHKAILMLDGYTKTEVLKNKDIFFLFTKIIETDLFT